MQPILHRALKAYRPLYLHGLWRDGQYPLPAVADATNEASASTRSTHSRKLLPTLTALLHHLSSPRSSS